MSGFISRAACRGRRPANLASAIVHERPTLSTRLLKDRSVARFIVAPSGYGKTLLAVEYAETMFSWKHTFWINGQSPCFVRDLDDESIASSCLAFDREVALVIFDDLPALDPDRARLLSREIDVLLAEKCEVVVTCVPSCDMVGPYQLDHIRVGACDLLLADDEMGDLRRADEEFAQRSPSGGAAERVAALVWVQGEGDAKRRFVKNSLDEELPADMLLAMVSAYVLGKASFADLRALGAIESDVLDDLQRDYPHFGFDSESERFEAPFIPIDTMAPILKDKLSEIVVRSVFSTPDQLAFGWVGALLECDYPARACDVVRRVCSRSSRASWALANAHELVRRQCFFSLLRLISGLEVSKGQVRMRLGAVEALCRQMLGDGEGALGRAKRVAFDVSAPLDARILCLLVVAHLDEGSMAQRADEALAQEAEAGEELGFADCSPWALIAQMWCVGSRPAAKRATLWQSFADAGVRDDVLCVCASWLYKMLDAEAESDPQVFAAKASCERFVRAQLAACSSGVLDFFVASAALSMEEAHNRGVRYEGGPLDTATLVRLRQVELGIVAQRRQLVEAQAAAGARHADWVRTHPDVLAATRVDPRFNRGRSEIPILSIRLFGRFEVAIGDTPIDQDRFTRRHVRSLLVLLAVNQGRELSRDVLISAMWPSSPVEVARKNYYTVWSQLRHSLMLPDGTCPYLVRHRTGCSLESRYVNSDVERLSDICRELLFGVPNIEHWSVLFAEIDRDFSYDLMPAEQKNRLVIQAREEYRSRLVDALVSATTSVIDTDNPQWGIWFARAALKHDKTREDAYVALMRAQIASNQRTAAMSTYMTCRHVLSDQLGIDPALETTLLYESLLDTERRP